MRKQTKAVIATAVVNSLLLSTTAWANPMPVLQKQGDAEQQQAKNWKKKQKVATIEIRTDAPDSVLHLGSAADERLTLTAVPKDEDGQVIHDKKIIWKSENKKVASVDSKGNVRAVGVGSTELIARMENVTASFAVTVKEASAVDKEQAIRDAIEAIDQLPSADQLTLADKADVISAREKVALAFEKGAKIRDITNLPDLIKAELKLAQLEKTAAEVASDKAELTIGFADGDTLDSVTQNVTLPLAGAKGSTISWESSDSETVDTEGHVTRPAGKDKQVTLTATITKKSISDSKSFSLIVKALPDTASLGVERLTINEDEANDGSITEEQIITVASGSFDASLSKDDVTVNHLPEGLDFEVVSVQSDRVNIRFTGKAVRHFDGDDEKHVSFTIRREKISGASDDLTTPEFAINFDDPDTISIREAKSQVGQTFTLKGIVTADNAAVGGGKLSTFMQDGDAGINIFSADPSGFPDLKAGDEIFVTGKITVYRGLTEIVPEAEGIAVVAHGRTVSAPEEITIAELNDSHVAEPLEGTLVTVTGYISNIPSSPAGGGYNISLIDAGFKGTTLRVMEGSLDISRLEVGKWYQVTAVLGQFDNGYQLIPRDQEDVELLQNQPSPPDSAGTYDSVVSSVVDGDTIHLTEPVLGATTVRFVNIDTPETYHVVKTPADQNQKDFGEQAKDYMKTLLTAGDRVQVKVGEQAKDAYGRLLAQVIRERDGLVTNLEMVRKGFASTYFIWPIDEDAFVTYQQAVKEAELEGLGIWNPNDPLLELPFLFRAREQQKGLTRQVGNYETKEYVSPEDWMAVPVESRVFFNSEEEAEQQGYTPIDAAALSDALAVANTKAGLNVNYDGTAAAVTLPTEGADSTAIEWSLLHPNDDGIIDLATGAVDRSTLQSDTTVNLVATIKKGEAVQQKGFPVLVKKISSADEQAVAAAKAALTISYDGTAPTISLPASGVEGTVVTWALQNQEQASIINLENGTVNRAGLTAAIDVVLVATITKGAALDSKQFTIQVKPEQPSSGTSDLFFSEYLEGSSNNKALELFNGTGQTIDLAAGRYAVALYSNGAVNPTNTVTLSGTLANNATFVIANSQANATILAKAQINSAVTNFNGDDALVLYKDFDPSTKTGTVLDVIGVVGSDPGTYWGATVKTLDQTLVRKSSVHTGNPNTAGPFDPALEWESKGIDYFDGLGSHTVIQ